MSRRFHPALVGLALASVLAPPALASAAEGKRVRGEPVRNAAKPAVPAWRWADYPQASVARLPFRPIALNKLAELENQNARAGIKPTQIGVNRDTATEAASKGLPPLRWLAIKGGGAVARLELRSPDALALRAGLQLQAVDPRVELRFAGSDEPSRVVASVKAAVAMGLVDKNGLFWTPSTDGEAQVIEFYAPAGVAIQGLRLQAPAVSHLVANSRGMGEYLQRTGASGSCNVDVVCRTAELGSHFVNAKNAVALMEYVKPEGTFICTGTLLADTVAATQLPYFYTADHCISSQSVANTLTTYWNYESTTCGGSTTVAGYTELTGGAAYLYSDGDTDASLLRLNTTPPAGAYFAGWDSTTIANSAAVRAIHHPAGDHKMVSQGQQISNSTNSIEVGWLQGTTEGGSSGSGLFTYDSNGFYLRGGLEGGSASCANDGNLNNAGNRDYYSRLDVVYPDISQYLDPQVANPGPTHDNTGAWYPLTEPGWGLTMSYFPNPNKVLFGLMFVYSTGGAAKWYEIDGSWTGNDVHSGNVLLYTGPAWSTTFNPAQVASSPVGTYTLTFTSASTATLTYTIEGVTRTVTVTKMGS